MPSKELALQKKVRDAINEDGGFAMVMSHRFVVGIPDMLIKVQGLDRSGIFEVKQREMLTTKNEFELPVTVPQRRYLRDMARADIPAGVLSFLRDDRKLYAAIFGPPEGGWSLREAPVGLVDHHFLVDTKCEGVVQLIRKFIEEWGHHD